VGIAIGILSWIAFLVSDKAIGCSTAFAQTGAMLERFVRGQAVAEKPYYRRFPPVITWEWMLVAGIMIGAWASAMFSGSFQIQWIPGAWATAYGHAPVTRWLVSLAGGTVVGFGARWAGGCTSGHGISGTLQLAVSSWLTVMCFFVGGVATAKVLFEVVGG
jgi:hypothetical protein